MYASFYANLYGVVSGAGSRLTRKDRYLVPSQKQAKARRREEREFKAALAQQLRFMYRSCELFDQGHYDEAIRIATHFRTIFHHGSGSSKSLLQHLNVNKNLELLSTVTPVSETTMKYEGMGMVEADFRGDTRSVTFLPNLDHGPFQAAIKFHDWWNQTVWVTPPQTHDEEPVRHTRKSIILTTVNKEGGAHVDAYVSADYERLATGATIATTFGDPTTTEMRIVAAHFVCLRQMGYEALHSRGILDLLRV